MAETKRWIVTLSGDKPLSDVEKSLADAGFNVERTMAEIGCIIGTPTGNIDQLRSIPGVADVSPDEIVTIGPPNTDPM